ncbi:Ras-GEF domain-containing protein [Entamoeba marina]
MSVHTKPKCIQHLEETVVDIIETNEFNTLLNVSKTHFTQTNGNHIILVDGVQSIVDMLFNLPQDISHDELNEIATTILFYPLDFTEDKILNELTKRIPSSPSRSLEIISIWITACGSEFSVKSLQIFQELLQIASNNGAQTDDVDKVKTILENVKSTEDEMTFSEMFEPVAVKVDGFAGIPRWMMGNDAGVNILNKNYGEIPHELKVCEMEFLQKLLPKDIMIYSFEQTRKVSNVSIYLKWSSLISQWVAYGIINQKTEQIRQIALSNFLSVAVGCLENYNFNSFVAILNEVPTTDIDLLHDLVTLQSKLIFTDYSTRFPSPSTPYLKHYLKEIITILGEIAFVDDNEQQVPSDDDLEQMIDVTKAYQIGKIINSIRKVTTTPPTSTNKQMHDFFMKTIRTLPLSNSDLLNMSLEAEPTE